MAHWPRCAVILAARPQETRLREKPFHGEFDESKFCARQLPPRSDGQKINKLEGPCKLELNEHDFSGGVLQREQKVGH